jgi:hypothetical protein
VRTAESRKNEEQAMKNGAEERKKCLVLEAELREVRELLNARGNI